MRSIELQNRYSMLHRYALFSRSAYDSATDYSSVQLERFECQCEGSEAICRVDRSRVQSWSGRADSLRLQAQARIGNAAIAFEQRGSILTLALESLYDTERALSDRHRS